MKKNKSLLTVKEVKNVSGLHYTLNHTGKMEGMQSLSTSCICNKFCQVYSKDPKRICSKCYAQSQMKIYTNMQKCFERNTEILTTAIIPKEKIPTLNCLYFRFEAFGDLNNTIQVINYFNICKKNKKVNFALWTKNAFLIDEVIKNGYKKPSNLQIILSSHYLNVQADNKYDFVDKVFTVYDKDFIEKNNIKVNCGAKSCLNCHKCYIKSKVNIINEMLK